MNKKQPDSEKIDVNLYVSNQMTLVFWVFFFFKNTDNLF